MRSKPSLLIIFLTVFIDLIGFGMIIPLLPYYALAFDASPLMVTFLSTIYSLMQFLFSPFWGGLSDRFGRRPVLLISIAGTACAYGWFAVAGSLTSLFMARLLGGVFTANFGAAQAYIADITTTENRAKGMGLFGAAFGLGFIVGPALGGLLSPFGYMVPGLVAASLSVLNFVFAWWFLPESQQPAVRARNRQKPFQWLAVHRPFTDFLRLRQDRNPVFFLILIVWVVITGHAMFEGTFALILESVLQFSAREFGLIFTVIGIVTAVVQGVLIGPLTQRFGNRFLIISGLWFTMLSLVILSLMSPDSLWLLYIGIVSYSFGLALFSPSMNGLISGMTHQDDQGKILGLSQGFGSLGRIVGPVTGGLAFTAGPPGLPLWAGATLMGLGLLLIWNHLKPDLTRS
ncbi:MAG: MFS transporter [Bacteroidetes bacterium]|nr:MFS transporter [Bacteroidota bacterium]